MKNISGVEIQRLKALPLLFLLLGLFGMRLANAEGYWSQTGVIPSIESETRQEVIAPDGRRKILATREGLQFVEVSTQSVQVLPVVAMQPLWEVIWAPDSTHVAVNASDGGAVGTWDATIFKLRPNGSISAFLVSSLVRRAAHTFAKCDSPEDVNVAVVGWEDNVAIAHVVAEVPPHSSCKNMGSLRGYRVAVKSERILESLSESSLKNRWAAELGLRFKR